MKTVRVLLSAITLSALPIWAQVPAKRASPEDVCSFITAKMKSAVPEMPVFCVPTNVSPGLRYNLSVFSTSDVLQGKMRRTWSVALFEAAQELFFGRALNGTCSSPKETSNERRCQLSVSDAYMSQRGEHYEIMVPSNMKSELYGDPSSDHWYQNWWDVALLGEVFDQYPGSMEDAERIANLACKTYIQKVQEESLVQARPQDLPVPTCSSVLATDSSVYVMIEFRDFGTAIVADYGYWLTDSFGASFSNTPYEGTVIFKSPWKTFKDGGVMQSVRSYRLYDLRGLEFCWEESHSGVRDPAQAAVLPMRTASTGQTDRDSPVQESWLGAVAKSSSVADGRELLDFTNGSEWCVSPGAVAQCIPHLGDKMVVSLTPTTPDAPKDRNASKSMLLYDMRSGCSLQAIFAGAW